MTENKIGTQLIEAAIAVHRELGPSLLEAVMKSFLPLNSAPMASRSNGKCL